MSYFTFCKTLKKISENNCYLQTRVCNGFCVNQIVRQKIDNQLKIQNRCAVIFT